MPIILQRYDYFEALDNADYLRRIILDFEALDLISKLWILDFEALDLILKLWIIFELRSLDLFLITPIIFCRLSSADFIFELRRLSSADYEAYADFFLRFFRNPGVIAFPNYCL